MLCITSPGLIYSWKCVPSDHFHLIPPPLFPSGGCSKFSMPFNRLLVGDYYLHLSSRLFSLDGEMKFGVAKWFAKQYSWSHPDKQEGFSTQNCFGCQDQWWHKHTNRVWKELSHNEAPPLQLSHNGANRAVLSENALRPGKELAWGFYAS